MALTRGGGEQVAGPKKKKTAIKMKAAKKPAKKAAKKTPKKAAKKKKR